MRNNPIRYIDPSGHRLVEDYGNGGCSTSGYCPGSSGSTYIPTSTSGNPGGNGGDLGSGDVDPESLDEELNQDNGDVIVFGEPDYKGCNQLGMSSSVCNTTIDILNGITIVADGLGLLISLIEWTFVGPPLILGLAVGAIAAIIQPELLLGAPQVAVDFLYYDAAVASMFAPFENNLALVSLGTTFGADWLEGYNYISNDGEIHVGTATTLSAATFTAGLIPEANIDFGASLVQFVADLSSIPKGSINMNEFLGNILP